MLSISRVVRANDTANAETITDTLKAQLKAHYHRFTGFLVLYILNRNENCNHLKAYYHKFRGFLVL